MAGFSRRIDLERAVKSRVPFILRRVINPYFDLERFFNDALRYQWMVRNQPVSRAYAGLLRIRCGTDELHGSLLAGL